MRPCCGKEGCGIEMIPEGRVVTLGYLHRNAPCDYSKAYRYVCPNCANVVYQPIGLSFGMIQSEPPDAILIQPPGGNKS